MWASRRQPTRINSARPRASLRSVLFPLRGQRPMRMPGLQAEHRQAGALQRAEQHPSGLAGLQADALWLGGVLAQAPYNRLRPRGRLALEPPTTLAVQHTDARLRQGDVQTRRA